MTKKSSLLLVLVVALLCAMTCFMFIGCSNEQEEITEDPEIQNPDDKAPEQPEITEDPEIQNPDDEVQEQPEITEDPEIQNPDDEVQDQPEVDENPLGLAFLLKNDGTYAVEVGEAKLLSTIQIPDTYNGKAVTEIYDYGFANAKNLEKLILPNGIEKIGLKAFAGCVNLTKVEVNSSPNLIWSISDGSGRIKVIGNISDWLVFSVDKDYFFTVVK